MKAEAILTGLRAQGWAVAVHNDYRLGGRNHTFWLFTHPCGRWAKGEGETDAEALDQVASLIDRYSLDNVPPQPYATRYGDDGTLTLSFND